MPAPVNKDLEILALRIQGLSQKSIAKKLDINSSTVSRSIKRLTKEAVTPEVVDQLVLVELERLDKLTAAVWNNAMSGDDKAVNTALRIMERRARLMGLDAPVRTELAGPGGGPVTIANWVDFVTVKPEEEVIDIVKEEETEKKWLKPVNLSNDKKKLKSS